MIKTPLKKVERTRVTVILYLFLMLLSYFFVVYYFHYHSDRLNKYFVYSIHFSFILSYALFFFSWLRDPGYLKKDESIDFFDIVDKFDANHLCPECEVIRTERSRHCNICNRCVERFDHHCPWINNCVGARNHGFFYCYILITIIYIVLVLLLCFLVLYYSAEAITTEQEAGKIEESPTYRVASSFPRYTVRADVTEREESVAESSEKKSFLDSLQWFSSKFGDEVILLSGIILLITGTFFFFPLLYTPFFLFFYRLLVSVQTKNMATNLTTSERFSRKKQG